ncbi:MAG: flagellar biosynthesis repressor FlbT [Bradyrhizobium sp.]|jgi:flagellar protein FlbT|nr:flagellar biosynthesis repressor FlbT [Bradyrhizobium sp.]
MKKPMCISLRGGERIYVNGAVLRVDRKVTLELINDVAFLLEGQVMQVADATTPLRQLYFVVQLMLMSPHDNEDATAVYREQRCALLAVAENTEMLLGLEAVEELVGAKRYYDALRKLRTLFDIEQSILSNSELLTPAKIA